MSSCQAPCRLEPDLSPATLNHSCDCLTFAGTALDSPPQASLAHPQRKELLAQRPHLFASTGIFVSTTDQLAMLDQIAAYEAISQLPGYRAYVQARSPHQFRQAAEATAGLLMGYDFHLTEDGPRLIEVNTNAGGAFVVRALLAAVRSHLSPCDPGSDLARLNDPGEIATNLVDMFITEWQREGKTGKPGLVAIVDDEPTEQYLYPDMLWAQSLLQHAGIASRIVASRDLRVRRGQLYHQQTVVDMVYNRVTDFTLSEPVNAALAAAWRDNLAVVSPSPSHHALYADKRNLSLLQDQTQLDRWGATGAQRQALAAMATVAVTEENMATLWSERKSLFFKPSGGYGGKATYRGSKLTRRVWQQIVSGGYVAQPFVPPARRTVHAANEDRPMKYDVRVFTYAGAPMLSAARIYQGQTTNFRSPGGGFAPLIYLD